jgi:hypothetical protein
LTVALKFRKVKNMFKKMLENLVRWKPHAEAQADAKAARDALTRR